MTYNYTQRLRGRARRPQVHDFNHIYKVLATSFLETLSPTRCVICDMPGDILCPQCASELPFINIDFACSRCGAPFGYKLCTECPNPGSEFARLHPERAFPFVGARAALSFEGGAKRIMRAYKDADELRLDAVIASFLCSTMRGWRSSKADLVTWADALCYIPASPEALLRRGFDHMKRIALICGKRTGLRVLDALKVNKGVLDQRNLGRDERMLNKSGSFSLVPVETPLPGNIVLIDDVFTTGATLAAATNELLEAGAENVAVVVCARVW